MNILRCTAGLGNYCSVVIDVDVNIDVLYFISDWVKVRRPHLDEDFEEHLAYVELFTKVIGKIALDCQEYHIPSSLIKLSPPRVCDWMAPWV